MSQHRNRFAFLLLAATLLASLPAGPAAADQVLTLLSHTDEMVIMGQKTPAKDVTQEYWFGDDATRFDDDETSVVLRLDQKKLFLINHAEKTFSAIDLPFDFKSLLGPEMAPMMEQMMKMMAPSITVTPTGKSGKYGGFACKYYDVAINISMMQMATTGCYSEELPVDYSRYRSLSEAQAELAANAAWIKELADKIKGFPVRTETTTTMMGKSFKSWQELKSVEDRTPPAGFYAPPAGYSEVKFDPMAQGQQRGKRR